VFRWRRPSRRSLSLLDYRFHLSETRQELTPGHDDGRRIGDRNCRHGRRRQRYTVSCLVGEQGGTRRVRKLALAKFGEELTVVPLARVTLDRQSCTAG
jgi:hypothetical protein